MNKFFKTLTLAAATLAFVACNSKSSDSAPEAAPLAAVEAEAQANPQAISASGAAIASSTVIDRVTTAGESSSGGDPMTLEEILAKYPVLAQRVSFLGSIDRVVETDARTLDLYDGDILVMTLGYNDAGALVVRSSTSEFAADSITFANVGSGTVQGQEQIIDTLHFATSSCIAGEEPPKEEPQEQDQGKVEQDDKETPKEEPKEEQEQEQKQEDKEEPKEECASVEVTLKLQQVIEKQEQEQGKEEKGQEQEQDGKGQAQGQDKGQAQDQDDKEQGQDKVTEEKKEVPADKEEPQEQDQGKAEQEQDKK